ncbi:hypothetical protein BaRGS_00014765 [Batillaria attramentaria]|uniref:Uncharacterized protein n=1 Tax=Batillaria attramentaria TaxID=370345 RepID=A0ABD0L2X4_9CAEN
MATKSPKGFWRTLKNNDYSQRRAGHQTLVDRMKLIALSCTCISAGKFLAEWLSYHGKSECVRGKQGIPPPPPCDPPLAGSSQSRLFFLILVPSFSVLSNNTVFRDYSPEQWTTVLLSSLKTRLNALLFSWIHELYQVHRLILP